MNTLFDELIIEIVTSYPIIDRVNTLLLTNKRLYKLNNAFYTAAGCSPNDNSLQFVKNILKYSTDKNIDKIRRTSMYTNYEIGDIPFTNTNQINKHFNLLCCRIIDGRGEYGANIKLTLIIIFINNDPNIPFIHEVFSSKYLIHDLLENREYCCKLVCFNDENQAKQIMQFVADIVNEIYKMQNKKYHYKLVNFTTVENKLYVDAYKYKKYTAKWLDTI